MKRAIAVLALGLSGFGVSTIINVPPAPAAYAGTFLSCTHSYSLSNHQALHSIPKKAHWPGTKAAHKVGGALSYTGAYVTIYDQVYTKSGWWDLTWDFYNTYSKVCPR